MKATSKLRGITLLSAIFGELSQHLPEGIISTEDLLESAQKLIELSKREYVTDLHPHSRRYPGYYSYDLCTAFDKYQGRILVTEMRTIFDPLANSGGHKRLKEILVGSREDMVLEEVYV